MANKQSAKKAVRQSAKRRLRNKIDSTSIKNLAKKCLNSESWESAFETFKVFEKTTMKVKWIHINKKARLVSRLYWRIKSKFASVSNA